MAEKAKKREPVFDPDDVPAWTPGQMDRAELAIGGKVLRPAVGTLTRPRGRPKSDNAKVHVSLRLERGVLDRYRATGPGWQTRVNDVLKAGAESIEVRSQHAGPVEAAERRSEASGKAVGRMATKVLRDPKASEAKSAAASALTQKAAKRT